MLLLQESHADDKRWSSRGNYTRELLQVVSVFMKLHEALKCCPQEELFFQQEILIADFEHHLDRNHEEPHPHYADTLRSVVNCFDLTDVWKEVFPKARQYT